MHRQCLIHTLCVASEEGLRGRNVLHSLCMHNCALMLNNICSEFNEHSKNEFIIVEL